MIMAVVVMKRLAAKEKGIDTKTIIPTTTKGMIWMKETIVVPMPNKLKYFFKNIY